MSMFSRLFALSLIGVAATPASASAQSAVFDFTTPAAGSGTELLAPAEPEHQFIPADGDLFAPENDAELSVVIGDDAVPPEGSFADIYVALERVTAPLCDVSQHDRELDRLTQARDGLERDQARDAVRAGSLAAPYRQRITAVTAEVSDDALREQLINQLTHELIVEEREARERMDARRSEIVAVESQLAMVRDARAARLGECGHDTEAAAPLRSVRRTTLAPATPTSVPASDADAVRARRAELGF